MAYPFKWRHYEGQIIILCVRWYLRYALSYRDLEEMMSERVYCSGKHWRRRLDDSPNRYR